MGGIVIDRVEINGIEADSEDLKLLARVNYAHFTSMQVRGGAVRGLDLHLKRLDESARELFGRALDAKSVRAYVRHALDGGPDAVSVRVTVFTRRLDAVLRGEAVEPEVAVATSAPAEAQTEPMRLRAVEYERDLPHVKHAGTFGLTHRQRQAVMAGYDDVLFTDRYGRISEASVWNIGFYDGDRIILARGRRAAGHHDAVAAAGAGGQGQPI
ncbi:aminotransferase class IV [Streptomyces sp. GS7]|uniref:aminotransferase class IV n=1 Tax=Streptomyces sp. GS7 TaxID=2692234 RepID=UPI00191676F3|nr:aminotransferase class IV [Streptomyces sp. GS7]